MNSPNPDTAAAIIAQARSFGASLAGIASVAALKSSRSYAVYHQAPYYNRAGG